MNLFGVFFRCETLDFAYFREREKPLLVLLEVLPPIILGAMQELFGFS